ncbi:acyl carrier protein [Actinomadura sp. KC216]|uniref:acyl carrier protein n=1 Tax=Actinomadura sp. KC216 TaxID=2530370 RepID=UPI001043740A|nr:phosphopantetheine-binding protein [Actinomadura sp. KC216]TDB82917.1 acyl carrier protein [Actinomadura sp. KC216]
MSDDIRSEVVRMLIDVVGEDFLLDVEIGPGTAFGDDLGLESIEFVALVDRLRTHYGDRVDFPAFIAGLDLDQLINLTIGDLVDHIAAQEQAHA